MLEPQQQPQQHHLSLNRFYSSSSSSSSLKSEVPHIVKYCLIVILLVWVLLVAIFGTLHLIHMKNGNNTKLLHENPHGNYAIHFFKDDDNNKLLQQQQQHQPPCYVSTQIPLDAVRMHSALNGSDNSDNGRGVCGSPYHHYHPSKDSNSTINVTLISDIEQKLFRREEGRYLDNNLEMNDFNALFPSWILFLGSMLSNPLQQKQAVSGEWRNGMSSFVDAGCLYSTDPGHLKRMRTGKCGCLKSDVYPDGENVLSHAATDTFNTFSELTTLYAGVLALHNLFLREHNLIAQQLCETHSHYSDGHIFSIARRKVIMKIQVITYKELIPACIGEELMEQACYKHSTNPFISAEWALAALPAFFSMLPEKLEIRDCDTGQRTGELLHIDEMLDQIPSKNVFNSVTVSEVLISLLKQPAESLDLQVAGSLPTHPIRDFKTDCRHPRGLRRKLACYILKLQLHPDKSDFVGLRWMFYVSPVTKWTDISSDFNTQRRLEDVYGKDGVYEMDLLPGLMAESADISRTMGHTLILMMADQLSRVRNADIFFTYWNMPSEINGENILSTRLRDILIRNTQILPRFLLPEHNAFKIKSR